MLSIFSASKWHFNKLVLGGYSLIWNLASKKYNHLILRMLRLEKIDRSIQESFGKLYDYLIIGAGVSGMQILEILSQKTSNIMVLEAQS